MQGSRQGNAVNKSLTKLVTGGGEGILSQFGALCWRRSGAKTEVLLVTSRDTGRWVIPKGWPIDGLTPEASAAREAFEEAGVEGVVSAHCLGLYSYDKVIERGRGPEVSVPCVVAVFPLAVDRLLNRFPEMAQRKRKWFSTDKAARRVAEPELQAILAAFSPDAAGTQARDA